jgi:ArsR family transcriptional regulator
MEIITVIKALSNESRLNILEWLKNPDDHFAPQSHLPQTCDFQGGICVGSIAEKAGLAQSVISGYLLQLQKAGLLESKRYGQWTYYRRNEQSIKSFLHKLESDL